MADQTGKRHYYTEQDWITFYQERQNSGELVDHIWLVDAGYCSSYEAARKLASRHVKRGILVPEFSDRTPYQSYRISHISNNVTLHADKRRIDTAVHPIDPKTTLVNKENNDSVQSLQLLALEGRKKEYSGM
jgi:hypothetical protein